MNETWWSANRMVISPLNYTFDERNFGDFTGQDTIIVGGLCQACGRFNWRHLFASYFDQQDCYNGNPLDILDGYRDHKPQRDNTIEFGNNLPTDVNNAIPLAPFGWMIANQHVCSFCRLIIEAIRETGQKVGRSYDYTYWSPYHGHYVLTWYFSRGEGGFLAEGSRRVDSILHIITKGLLVTQRVSQLSFGLHDDGVTPLRFLKTNSEKGRIGLATASISRTHIELCTVKHWLRQCFLNHDSCRISHKKSKRNVSTFCLRVIDVLNNEVVVPPDDSDYIALSYVWGGVKQYNARSKDFVPCSKNHKWGSQGRPVLPIDRTKLPITIQDAMIFVEAIGERYLWVDALCIVQDDHSELKSTLQSMDRIYEEALFTVIAASGYSANSGLGGILPSSRNILPITQEIDGIPLILSKKPLDIEHTPWSKRGWTFQEAVFSQKWLIFADDRVYYGCSDGILGEDRPDDFFAEEELYKKLHCINARLDEHWDSAIFWEDYTNKVKQYTSRILTHSSDILDAFAGLARRYEEQTGSPFSWGLPTHTDVLFSASLLWRPGKDYSKDWSHDKPHWRRHFLQRRGPPDPQGGPGTYFPSYSWAGWSGGNVEWEWPEETRVDISHITTPIEWSWKRGNLVEVEEQAFHTGVLTFEAQVAILSREDLNAPGFVFMDNGTIWKTGSKLCVLLAEVPGISLQESIVYVLILKEEKDGAYVREGAWQLSKAWWEKATVVTKKVQLR